MRCECVRRRALSRSLSPVEWVAARTVVQLICENDRQNGVSTDFRVQITVFCVMPYAFFQVFFGTMSQRGLPERPPPDAEAMESSLGTDQGDTPKKGRKKKPIPEMKLTADVQQLLWKKNGNALKVKITDLKIDKTKERGQIRQIDHDNVAKKVVGNQALPPPGPLRVTECEDSGMTRFALDPRHFFSLLWYMICVADGSLYVLRGQHGTETCRKIQEMRLAEGKELEDWKENCSDDIVKYKTPWRIQAKVAGLQQAGSQSLTWIPLPEALDNMLLCIEDQKPEKEPQDFERFKTAVVQAAVNPAFLAREWLEEPGHTVCVRASYRRSAPGLVHSMTLFSLVRLTFKHWRDIFSLAYYRGRHAVTGMKNLESKSKREDVTRNAFKKLEGLHLPIFCRKSVTI